MPIFLLKGLAWLKGAPTVVALLLALVVGAAVIATGISAARSIAAAVRGERDSVWLQRLGAATDKANEKAAAEARRAAEAVEAARVAAESEEAARSRATALEQRIYELSANPVCIPRDVVQELNK